MAVLAIPFFNPTYGIMYLFFLWFIYAIDSYNNAMDKIQLLLEG
jgi:hypothetical protein